MNVASLELCKELYELSSWFDQASIICWSKQSYGWDIIHLPGYIPGDEVKPAYHLSYLLRKLPEQSTVFSMNKLWNCGLVLPDDIVRATADTPEDAACKLAIELFKQGILEKEGK